MVYLLVVADEKWAAPPQTGFAVMPGEPQKIATSTCGRATRIFGRVTGGKGRKPVAGQSVQSYQSGLGIRAKFRRGLAEPEDKRTSTTPYYVRYRRETDAEGRYELFVGPGTYDIRGPSQSEDREIHDHGRDRDGRFNFHSPREERGRLKGAGHFRCSGATCALATIEGVISGYPGVPDLDVTADADGRFDVERELHGDGLCMRSRPTGMQAGVVEIGPDDTQVTIPIEPAASASGRLINPDTRPRPPRSGSSLSGNVRHRLGETV